MANNYQILSEDAIKYLCGLIRDLASVSEGIDNINLADDKTFSNIYIKNLIDKCLEDANAEAEKLVGALTHLTCEETAIQPTLDNSEINVIYLYSADGNPPYQQFLKISEDKLVDLGSTSISLEDYIKAADVAKDYATKVELKAVTDKIGTTTLTTTDTTITGAIEEVKGIVDDKVDKADIATTIDSTSTDSKVTSAKAVYDKILDSKKVIVKIFTDTNGGDFIECLNSLGLDTDKIYSLGFSSLYTNLPHTNGWWEVLIVGSFTEKMCIARNTWANEYYTADLTYPDGAWLNRDGWKKICTTSVADTSGTVTLPDSVTGVISYKVVNGICYVSIQGLADGLTGVQVCTFTGLPKADIYINIGIEYLGNRVGTIYTDDGVTFYVHKTTTNSGYGSFSYPVAES